MHGKTMTSSETTYGEKLEVAITAIHEAIYTAIDAEYDSDPNPYEDSHVERLAGVASLLKRLHQDLFTYKPKEDE